MVRTRGQLENLSKEELIEELINIEDISKLYYLTSHFNDFLRRYEICFSELTVSKNCNRLLSERTVQSERNAINNFQYHCHESLEINHVPASIGDVVECSICRALSLTGHEVKPDVLQACHCLKKRTLIVKFKCREQKCSILINRKNLRNKLDVLTQLIFLVGSSFWRACVTRTTNYLINVDS